MSTSSYVTAGKPKVGGAVSVAPVGTPLPTTANEAPNGAFKNLGYLSEDGLKNNNSPSTDKVKAWGGDVVLIVQTEKNDTFTYKLIEYMNTDVLKTVYGSDNVTGTLATGIAIRANAAELPEQSYVIDQILRGGVIDRIVIPRGKISEIAEISYADSDVVGFETTIEALPDANGNSHYEYIYGAAAVDKAVLTGLTVGTLELSPAFSAGVTSYGVATTNASDVVTASAGSGASIVIKHGDDTVTNGSSEEWGEGANVLTITVTETGKASNTYTVTVTKS